jgi:sugar/nucleoside kinase (ribokinase family)
VGLLHGEQVRQASRTACLIASLSVTKAGTIPAFPGEEEAASFVATQGRQATGLP